MIRPDLIIFDCDGVLVDSEVLSCRCLSEALAAYGIESWSSIRRSICFLDEARLRSSSTIEALGRAIPEQFAAELRAGVRAAFLSALCPIEGVSSVLEDLQIPHCVASSSDVDRVSFSLSLTGLAPHFETRLLYLADGGTRQAGARSLPVRRRKDAGGSAPHPRDRGQRERRDGGQGGRHDGLGICRRQPLSIA